MRFSPGIICRYALIVALWGIRPVCAAPAAGAETGPGPRIGLVLGGGGARGAAHVGVLKVLEENGVPVDLIVGTSMGAIVGGLYAAGFSPGELEDIFNKTDWKDLFNDSPSEEYLPFRHKKDQQRFMAFELGVNREGIALPRGVIAGQKLDFLLKKYTLHVSGEKDFDSLPVPFRAVSADLATGEAVVHGGGDLAGAIRASMSIPGIFPPVEMDGKYLIDGGVVSNLPVEVAREMGADIIIAVDVGMAPVSPEKLRSFISIAGQVLSIYTKKNTEQSLALLGQEDIVITPDLGDIATQDFTRVPEAIVAGEKAGRNIIEEIKKYSVPPEAFQSFLAGQRKKEPQAVPLGFVEIREEGKVDPGTIRGRMKTRPGEDLDLNTLEEDLTRIYAMGDFETVGFSLEQRQGEKGLIIDAREKTWGPGYLRFGFNLSDDSEGDSNYTSLADLRLTGCNDLGGEWKTTVQMGQRRGVFSEFYQPLDARELFFIAPYINLERYREDVYSDDERIGEYDVEDIYAGVDVGINLGDFARVHGGVVRGSVDAEQKTGAVDFPAFKNIEKAAYVLKAEYDQFDDHRFPTKGVSAGVSLFASDSSLGADASYEKVFAELSGAVTFREKHTLLAHVDTGISIDEETPFYDEFTLGGLFSLSGYKDGQLRGQHRVLGSLTYYYKVGEPGFAKQGVYLGAACEAGNIWDDRDDIDVGGLLLGGTVFLGVDTLLGPFYIGYGEAEGSDEGRFYFFLGRAF